MLEYAAVLGRGGVLDENSVVVVDVVVVFVVVVVVIVVVVVVGFSFCLIVTFDFLESCPLLPLAIQE